VDVFLVARPQCALLRQAARLQEELNNRYRLYSEALPPLHLTVARITLTGEQSLSQVVANIKSAVNLAPSFTMKARGYLRFGAPHLAVGIAIAENEALLALRASLRQHLGAQMVELPGKLWRPHITLLSAAFANGNWSEALWREAFEYALTVPIDAECAVKELELWYPEYQPELNVVARFGLS